MKFKHSKLRLLLFIIMLLIVSIICMLEANSSNDDYTEEVIYESKEAQANNTDNLTTKTIVKKTILEEQLEMFDEYQNSYLLAKIAMAEAEGETTEGKALVILVVLNRVNDDRFPDTIEEVIYQKNQFQPILDGRFENNEPNEDCYKALELVRNGWDESKGALYFESSKSDDSWHSRNLDYLFKLDGHKFYK